MVLEAILKKITLISALLLDSLNTVKYLPFVAVDTLREKTNYRLA